MEKKDKFNRVWQYQQNCEKSLGSSKHALFSYLTKIVEKLMRSFNIIMEKVMYQIYVLSEDVVFWKDDEK